MTNLSRVHGWWDNAVVYEIYPRSFQDSGDDGIGDLRGIARRLEYLEWLGVDAIWIAPIYVSPLADFGYDVADHTAIAPEYGTLEDFDALLAEAHGRGIRVLLDLVVSHTSIKHRWFREHPDRYVWADGPEPPNNWVASFGGPTWTRDERTGRLYLHSFYVEQPDLDWRNPEVRRGMSEVVRFWADRGVDGFRVDAVDRMVKDLALRDDPPGAEPFPLPVHADQQDLDLIHSRDAPDIEEALDALRIAAGELPLIGEVYLPVERARRYLDRFEAAFTFDLLHSAWDADELAGAIRRSLALRRPAWVVSNHDFPRVATRWGLENARSAAILLLSLGGSAFVYQGEELGMAEGPGGDPPLDRYGRDGCRHPIRWSCGEGGGFSAGKPWLPLTGYSVESVEAQRQEQGSMLSLFRSVIRLRRELAGSPEVLGAWPGRLAFARGEHVVVVNLGGEPVPLPPEADAAAPPLAQSRDDAVDAAGIALGVNSAAILQRPRGERLPACGLG